MTSLINASSPLVWDAHDARRGARSTPQNNQATIITPFILAGAMAPATVGRRRRADAGRVAGRHDVRPARAPGRAGDLRLVRQLDVDADRRADVRHPRAGARAVRRRRAGPPARRAVPVGRLADRVEAARRAGRVRERGDTLQPTVLGGVNFVLHAAGWLEGGLAIGYEKFVLDADQLGMMATFVKGLDLSENGQALDAIRENPPGQHFLGTAHTLANFETAFYRSDTADNSSFEQWLEDGGLDAAQRANRLWKRSPGRRTSRRRIDDAIDAELLEFVARRKAELPDTFA